MTLSLITNIVLLPFCKYLTSEKQYAQQTHMCIKNMKPHHKNSHRFGLAIMKNLHSLAKNVLNKIDEKKENYLEKNNFIFMIICIGLKQIE